MCDLFGLSCNEEDRATWSLPKFAELFSRQNPQGWGIAYYNNNKAVVVRPQDGEPYIAADSPLFDNTIKKARSTNIISHVRHATHGYKCELNCHPFIHHRNGRDWTFAHNGQVFGKLKKHPAAEGGTDSENIFHQIMDYVDEYMRGDTIHGLYPALKKAVKRILDGYGKDKINLNFLMSDGNMHYAFSHYDDKPMYMLGRTKGYGGAILLSTQKVTDENWRDIGKDRLLAINCGEILIRSDEIILKS